MAAEVVALPRLQTAPPPSIETLDQKYWSSFTTQILLPTPASSPVTYISSNISSSAFQSSLSASSPYIAVTAGSRLQLISPQTLKPVRTISRTTSTFHGASVRRDGRIVLAGSDSGSLQAFDTTSRAILKTWSDGHKEPIWVSKWHPRDLTSAMSCADDGTVRLWDLTAEKSTWCGWGHEDYVRSGSFVGEAGNLIATGSYDRSIRLWDPRVNSSSGNGSATTRSAVMHFKLSAPVEAILPLPGGTTLAGAAGEKLVVLDLVAGKPLQLLRNHQKTITSLTTASQGSRVLTGALDGHVKIFDTTAWQVVAGFKYPAPILALDMCTSGASSEDRHLCVGMQSGLVSIRSRLSGAARAARREKELEMAALAAGKIEEFDKAQQKKLRKSGRGKEIRLRGKDYTGEDVAIVIEGRPQRKQKIRAKWEIALGRAEYAKALDLALLGGDRLQVMTLLAALKHRSALRTAIKNRSATNLLPLLRWLNRNVHDPRFTRVTTEATMTVLDMYAEHLGQSPQVDTAVLTLRNNVRQATEVAQMCCGTIGMLELLSAGGAKS